MIVVDVFERIGNRAILYLQPEEVIPPQGYMRVCTIDILKDCSNDDALNLAKQYLRKRKEPSPYGPLIFKVREELTGA